MITRGDVNLPTQQDKKKKCIQFPNWDGSQFATDEDTKEKLKSTKLKIGPVLFSQHSRNSSVNAHKFISIRFGW